MNSKIKYLYAKLKQASLDGLLLSSAPNISYLSNLRSRDSYLLVSPKDNVYITDARYTEEIKKNLKGCVLRKINGSFFKTIASSCVDLGLKRMGFEERYLPFAEYKKLKSELGTRADLIPTYNIVEDLREIKNPREMEKIKKAARITIAALEFIKGFIAPGIKEIEVAAELERFIRYHGADAAAFEIIVASGPNSSFPHHITSARKIRNNEAVLIDIGADYLGYKSDLTRVFFLGKMNTLSKRIYAIIKEAQSRAIRKIKPGSPVNEVDRAARQYITERGYGGFFSHNTGHGIGLEVHEAPHISGRENKVFKEGMVLSVEPAIYLPGKFGIRIEDMVVVTRKGTQLISGSLHK
ncbi:MAG: aminopeptidase P family protein [Candidatus Omnitrophota bacterium]|jgi:Xaa-Pro aminopeptidase